MSGPFIILMGVCCLRNISKSSTRPSLVPSRRFRAILSLIGRVERSSTSLTAFLPRKNAANFPIGSSPILKSRFSDRVISSSVSEEYLFNFWVFTIARSSPAWVQ